MYTLLMLTALTTFILHTNEKDIIIPIFQVRMLRVRDTKGHNS
jgi:hypothetical protein